MGANTVVPAISYRHFKLERFWFLEPVGNIRCGVVKTRGPG